ncbi:GapS4a family protein [Pseudoalteromonas prydzensis]|uniref:GapS4a family protein n=1 Tax=Pseudoalteromonas prydzensis TaxID=182141 RepID=UPI0024BC165E|nr:hypothetical protein [Pseudoalteromonas prydzensis]
MGEKSKEIGEKGEKLVNELLTVIGWSGLQNNESIPCLTPEEHMSKNAQKPRSTHGIDIFFSDKSNLEDFTLENVVVSVKYTSKPYPSAPSSIFKEHLKDLAQTIECFMKSNLRAENNEDFEMTGIRKANDTGVLFWLSNHKDSDQDVISKIANINLDKSLNFSTIHVVDNSRASFIYSSIKFIQDSFKEYDYFFHYAFSSANYTDPNIQKFGNVLPVEYLSSNLLPFRLIDKSTGKISFCVVCRDEFSEEAIKRLIHLASDVSQDFTGEFFFLFPDYDPLLHEKILQQAQRVTNKTHSMEQRTITVKSYKEDFRGLINE